MPHPSRQEALPESLLLRAAGSLQSVNPLSRSAAADVASDGTGLNPGSELLNHIDRPAPEGADYTGIVKEDDTLAECRRLVADVYEKWEYITPADRTPERFIGPHKDPHVGDSKYFVRKRGDKVVATVRSIKKHDIAELPALKELSVDPRRLISRDPNPGHYAEVSALAKDENEGHRNDVLAVYAELMKEALLDGTQFLLMSADTRLAGKLRQLFGRRSFTSLGDPVDYMGSPTEPMLMDIHKALGLFRRRFIPHEIKQIFRDALRDMDTTDLPPHVVKALQKGGVFDKERDRPKRISMKNLATAGLVLYTFSRAGVIPATSLDDDGVNPYIFLGLDVATIRPYVEGLARATDKDKAIIRRLGAGAMAGASFMLPYAYVAYAAEDYSQLPEATGIFAGMLGAVAMVKKGISMYKARRTSQTTVTPAS